MSASASILGVPITPDGAEELARRARGTPRIANRLLKRVRDYAQVKGDGTIDERIARAALDAFEVDQQGFDQMDRKLLLALIEKFNGGPVGVESLAAAIGEERVTIEDVYEPYLIRKVYAKDGTGRVACPKVYAHFGLNSPGAQKELF